MIKLVTANMPAEEFDTKANTTVFLAGPITFAPDWQSEFVKGLREYQEKHEEYKNYNITVYSPRWVLDPEGETIPFNYKRQYDWETFHIQAADIIVFGFVPYAEEPKLDRSYARTTRIELGEAIGRNNALREYQEDMPYDQSIFVYKDKNYTDDKDGYIELKVSSNKFIWTDNWERIYSAIIQKCIYNIEDFANLRLRVRGLDSCDYYAKYAMQGEEE